MLSSKNKEQVAAEIQTLETAKSPEDVIRDPYVLEFLGLTPNDDFYESDLEQALITHLQKFLFGTWQRLFICRKAEKNNVLMDAILELTLYFIITS